MRTPVPIHDDDDTNRRFVNSAHEATSLDTSDDEALPRPARVGDPALFTRDPTTGRLDPTPKFIEDLCVAIRAGARTQSAAVWCGASKKLWFKFCHRTGPIYSELRLQVAHARAACRVKLQAEFSKRHPDRALKFLREPAIPEPRYARQNTRSHLDTVTNHVPKLLQRITDDTIAPSELSPFEVLARDWRTHVIQDLGGPAAITTTKLALINSALASWMILSTVDAYLMRLNGRIIDRTEKKLIPAVLERSKLVTTFTRQLQALGLDKTSAPQTLADVIEATKR